MHHLLTVGIPVYNAMPYLAESVQSILGQSYIDFEVLAIMMAQPTTAWLICSPCGTGAWESSTKRTKG